MSDDLAEAANRYLDLLAGCLTGDLEVEHFRRPLGFRTILGHLRRPRLWGKVRTWQLTAPAYPDGVVGERSVTPAAVTMLGRDRLANIRDCVVTAVRDGVPGDLAEAGIWKGGAAIYLRALLAALGDEHRQVWACDSFEGLPAFDADRTPIDDRETAIRTGDIGVGIEVVRRNFARYDLLDERVHFVEGWFRDTLPDLAERIDALAVLRLDGDLYESTMDTLVNLEPLVSPGGFVIVDDYFVWEGCRAAVDDYRRQQGIEADMVPEDWCAAHWRKLPTAEPA